MTEDRSNKRMKLPKTAIVAIVIALVSALICIVVHALFKMKSPFHWLEAEWTAGEILTFISSVIIFFGTYLLGIHTSEISNKISEDNNRLQKILAQNSLPAYAVNDARVAPTMDCDCIEQSIIDKKQSFTMMGIRSNEKTSIKININIDANKKCFVKKLTLLLENISDVPIRHLAIEKIVFNEFKDNYDKVECINALGPKSGKSIAIRPTQIVQIDINVYYDNNAYEKVWENDLGGLTLTLFMENTSFQGEKFQQNICVRVPNNGLWDAKYGDNHSQSMET